MAAGKGETMNQLDNQGSGNQGDDGDSEHKSKRIKLGGDNPGIKENHVDDGSGKVMKVMEDEGVLSDPIDDGSGKLIEIVEDEDVLSGLSTYEPPSKAKYAALEAPYYPRSVLGKDDDPDWVRKAHRQWMRKKWNKKLKTENEIQHFFEERKMRNKQKWANWEGECDLCGDVDVHPTKACPYMYFIDA